jgi:hypothetical protein
VPVTASGHSSLRRNSKGQKRAVKRARRSRRQSEPDTARRLPGTLREQVSRALTSDPCLATLGSYSATALASASALSALSASTRHPCRQAARNGRARPSPPPRREPSRRPSQPSASAASASSLPPASRYAAAQAREASACAAPAATRAGSACSIAADVPQNAARASVSASRNFTRTLRLSSSDQHVNQALPFLKVSSTISSLDLFKSFSSLEDRRHRRSEPRALNSSKQKMQLVKIAIAIVAVALTPSEGAENHAVNKALLSQQVANHLRGGQTSAYSRGPCGDPTIVIKLQVSV